MISIWPSTTPQRSLALAAWTTSPGGEVDDGVAILPQWSLAFGDRGDDVGVQYEYTLLNEPQRSLVLAVETSLFIG